MEYDFIANGYKAGDKVWYHLGQKWVVIKSIYLNVSHPLVVKLSDGVCQHLTEHGKEYEGSIVPLIFPNEFKIPPEAYERPLPKFKKNQPLIVWEKDENIITAKARFHFSHFVYGKVYCYGLGKTSFSSVSTVSWSYYRLPTKEELGDFPGEWEYEGKEK